MRVRAVRVLNRVALVFLLVGLLVPSACGTSETRDVVGPGVDTTDQGGGNVQRATLTVSAIVGPHAQAHAAALGWGNVVGNAQISIVRVGSTAPLTTTSDAAGIAVFTGLLPGSYRISGGRPLDAAERTHVISKISRLLKNEENDNSISPNDESKKELPL
jgi:hypothetical protein